MDGLSFLSHHARNVRAGTRSRYPVARRKGRTDVPPRRCLVGDRQDTKGSAMDKPLKVMIIGAVTGGLCLAHGLARDGIAVEVFERDDSPADRQPGYRLSISATGSAALRSCLPEAHYRKLIANSSDPSSSVTFLDHQLNELLRINLPHADREAEDAERPVSRATLRRILLEGVEHVVRFGKKFEAFADGPHVTIIARVADGSAADGNLLVGADGAN